MRPNKLLTSVQVAVLLVLLGLVIFRVLVGPEPPRGLVVLSDIDDRELRHRQIRVDKETEVVIRATGSVDHPGQDGRLAAYAWILGHSDLSPVWEMNSTNLEAGKGSLVHVMADTIALAAGGYDIFYSTYGPDPRSTGRWRRDRHKWLLVLDTVREDDAGIRALATVSQAPSTAFWSAAPLGNNEHVEHLFAVNQATGVDVLAVGQLARDPSRPLEDYAWIEQAETGEIVWQLTGANSEPAGGFDANRRFSGTVQLAPGIYKVAARTGNRHAYDRWAANPPYNPRTWGVTLTMQETDVASPFDHWTARESLVRIDQVGDDVERREVVEVRAPTSVIVDAVGEITRAGSRYDFATLLRAGREEDSPVWSMTWNGSVHAGGATKNRREIAFLVLDPGTYKLLYTSDDSHSAEHWNAPAPDFPERWGVSMFPVIESRESVSVLGNQQGVTMDAINPALVEWTQLRGNERKSHAFKLARARRIHIVATGEISGSIRYDYGWITADNSTVWEMTRDNTLPAGGSPDNRRFDGVVELEKGDYHIHFETDGSHHYGSFMGAPDDPEFWGITLRYADK